MIAALLLGVEVTSSYLIVVIATTHLLQTFQLPTTATSKIYLTSNKPIACSQVGEHLGFLSMKFSNCGTDVCTLMT